MDLLLDIGNTNLKWAWRGERGLGDVRKAAYRKHGVAALARQLWGEEAAPARVWAANVGGTEAADALRDWVDGYWSVPLSFVTSTRLALGVTNGYRQPAQLGVDRWLAIIAASRLTEGPYCVVDCGTAVTLDAVDPQRRHLGGLIMPGLSLMRNSLLQATHIPPVTDDAAIGWLASGTAGAVAGGTLLAAAGLVERFVRERQRAEGVPLLTVMTGSDAPSLAKRLQLDYRVEPDLVMHGLRLVAEESEAATQ